MPTDKEEDAKTDPLVAKAEACLNESFDRYCYEAVMAEELATGTGSSACDARLTAEAMPEDDLRNYVRFVVAKQEPTSSVEREARDDAIDASLVAGADSIFACD